MPYANSRTETYQSASVSNSLIKFNGHTQAPYQIIDQSIIQSTECPAQRTQKLITNKLIQHQKR